MYTIYIKHIHIHYMHAHIYIYMCVFACIYMCNCVIMYIHLSLSIYIYIHIMLIHKTFCALHIGSCSLCHDTPSPVVLSPREERLIYSNVGITIINHPPVITKDIWYKPLPNIPSHGWLVTLLYPHCCISEVISMVTPPTDITIDINIDIRSSLEYWEA